jgi:hypothetical protein
MGEKLADAACRLSWQAFEDILHVCEWIETVEFRRLDETHDISGTLTGAQRASK